MFWSFILFVFLCYDLSTWACRFFFLVVCLVWDCSLMQKLFEWSCARVSLCLLVAELCFHALGLFHSPISNVREFLFYCLYAHQCLVFENQLSNEGPGSVCLKNSFFHISKTVVSTLHYLTLLLACQHNSVKWKLNQKGSKGFKWVFLQIR